MSNKVYDALQTTQGGGDMSRSAIVDDRVKEIYDCVEKAVANYDPDAEEEDENLEFHEKEAATMGETFFRFADGCDTFLLWFGIFWAFAFGAALPGFCVIFGSLVDDMGTMGVGEQKENPMKTNSLNMIYVACGTWVTSGCYISALAVYSESIAHKLKIKYFEKALSKDAAFYDEQNPNEMASKINKEAQAVRRGLSEKIGNIAMSCSGFILGYVAAFLFGWKLSLILLGGLPFILASGIAFGVSLQTGTVEQMKAYSQSAGYAEQALQSVRIVHTYGNEMLEFTNYSKYLERARAKQRKSSISVAFAYASLFGLIFLFYAAAFYFGGMLKWKEITEDGTPYTGGRVISIMFCIIFGAMQIGGSGPGITALQQARVAFQLALNVIDQVPKVNPEAKGIMISREQIKGNIEFKDVCFTYPTRQDVQVLNNFTCNFEAGKTTALVGPSGSGKSTIIQMIERFYKNDSGTISVDGHPIEKLDLRNFRRLIGYVGQEPVLFNASIRENMKFAKPDASDEEIRQALLDANAWNFIQKIETGLDTIVGGSGGSLSGGQKQRVAIARAFLKKPRILLLDEATSALDKVNEKIVQKAIDSYRKANPITIIVIAHRLTTIRDADKIVVLVNGRLTELGNHDQLMQQYPDGTYADFCRRQAASEANNTEVDDEAAMAKEDEVKAAPEPEEGKKRTLSRQATITDKKTGKVVTKTLDGAVSEKLNHADDIDEEREKEIEAQMKPLREKSDFMKVMDLNEPIWVVFLACFIVGLAGLCQPFFGWVFSDMLTTLTLPITVARQLLILENKDPEQWKDDLEEDVVKLVVYMLILAGIMFVGYLGKSYLFSYLGENVTLKIRTMLYKAILAKNIGWFDQQENQSSVLTSAMAADSAMINGASSEALGPYVEAFTALFGGLVIGFFFCWQEALITLGCVPFIAVGNFIAMQFEKGLSGATGDTEKAANLLIGDAINNFKTVQSFGYEHLIVQKYRSFVDPIYAASRTKHIKAGIAYGFSQFIVYIIFAALFYFGGMIIDENCTNTIVTLPNGVKFPTQECTISPTDVFIALFAIFFGANQAGTALAFGPDAAKAAAAATKIFKIIEYPSEIDAIKMDKDTSLKKLNPESVKGKIEFKNVWFRYPTRKDDFVLKGLTLTINPNESVALVGESGCGKSTFVNLMMRFYDPNFGDILLDGVNIKEYNLHSLRKGVSLVMQEPSIFNYSIKDNVLYGKLNAKNSEIQNATQIANCQEFIEKGALEAVDDSPAGLLKEMDSNKTALCDAMGAEKYQKNYEALTKLQEVAVKKGLFEAIDGDVDTRNRDGPSNYADHALHKGFEIQCGLKGGKLSGGQKQRVAIARTLVGQPKVLLLDEATSALDETSQKKVQTAIESAMQNRTTIIIAHRMSTIEKCNKIFVLEEGRVKEEGGFNDLKGSGGLFSKLAQNKQE